MADSAQKYVSRYSRQPALSYLHNTDAHRPAPWSSAAIDAASHGAIAFCQIYYEAYDEPTRRASVRLTS